MDFAKLGHHEIFLFFDASGQQRAMRKLSPIMAKEILGVDRLYNAQFDEKEWIIDPNTSVTVIDSGVLKQFICQKQKP